MKDTIRTLIFDVNETLLDMSPLKESINRSLHNDMAAEIWFAELLQYSLVESITSEYHDFSKIAAEVLHMNAWKFDISLSEDEIKEVLSPINQLKPYDDVIPGLKKLKAEGYKLIAFSNGKPSVVQEQLKFAEIEGFFDEILSVEAVKKYKPHPETYAYAVSKSGIATNKCMMVAAHGWDITGAIRAGLRTAFINRPGKFMYYLGGEPSIETKTIESLARELSA